MPIIDGTIERPWLILYNAAIRDRISQKCTDFFYGTKEEAMQYAHSLRTRDKVLVCAISEWTECTRVD